MSKEPNAIRGLLLAAALAALGTAPALADNKKDDVQLGQRPFFLVDRMEDGPLRDKLMQCRDGKFRRTDFSIGHRGAALQFPEHTRESYIAAARQGAGIVECDVTFTADGGLVCRHAENDLHTTTNILADPVLASTCIKPFTPAAIDEDGKLVTPASAECRTSALTLDEFYGLQGKMDAFNPAARSVSEYLRGTAPWRTDLYTPGTLMSFRDSIELNKMLGVKHTPELKSGDPAKIAQVFGSQEAYALAFAKELRDARVKPHDVWPQSFNVEDVFTWIDKTEYGKQAVYLLDYDATDPVNDIVIQPPYDTTMSRTEYFKMLKKRGVRIVAPPMPALLAIDAGGRIVPSQLARDLRSWGFDIITWTFERSDLRFGASKAGYYYDFDPQGIAIKTDGDMYKALDVLAKDVKILGIFSDWPATVTYFANCMGLR
jgi:glycerophosphoryl diester phosphodiesterase